MVVGREAALVAPLVGVDVVEGRRVLLARRHAPVGGEGDRAPGSLVDQLLLPDVVGQPAAVDADAAGQHQRDDAGAVEQVVVIPVVGAGADDDQVLAVGLLGVLAPLAGKVDQRIAVDAGVLLLPGGRIGQRRRRSATAYSPGRPRGTPNWAMIRSKTVVTATCPRSVST